MQPALRRRSKVAYASKCQSDLSLNSKNQICIDQFLLLNLHVSRSQFPIKISTVTYFVSWIWEASNEKICCDLISTPSKKIMCRGSWKRQMRRFAVILFHPHSPPQKIINELKQFIFTCDILTRNTLKFEPE